MNSATVYDSWYITLSFRCFALLLLVVIYFAIGKEDVPFWEFSRALTLQGQLPMESWNQRCHNTKSRASFCVYQMPKGSTHTALLLSALCNSSMQAWLT